jgi:hypothetical protein
MRLALEDIPLSGELFLAILLFSAIGSCYYRTINHQLKHNKAAMTKLYKDKN